MIPKKKEETQEQYGQGRPFEMNLRYNIEKNDEERQRPVIIHLGDLNGQTSRRGMPKNFHKKAGRQLLSFTKYWTKEEADTQLDDGFDIE